MRLISLIALLFAVAPFARVAVQDPEVRVSHWPDGSVRSQIDARVNLRGEMVREGRAEIYHESGGLSVRGQFHDDQRHGRWSWFSPDGALVATCEYRDGVGLYRDLFPNGRTLREGTMVGEVREGEWREYWPSGRLKLRGTYVDGEQHGRWTAYSDEDPPRTRSAEFEHGVQVGES